MQDATVIQGIESRYTALVPLLDERMRRQWAAAEAQAYGWGGVRAVSCAIGMSPNTIVKGLAELAARKEDPGTHLSDRLRAEGGGRWRATDADPELGEALERLVNPKFLVIIPPLSQSFSGRHSWSYKSHTVHFNFLFCFSALSFPRGRVDRPDFAKKLEVAVSGPTRLDPPKPATCLVLRTIAAHGANPAAPNPVTWAEGCPTPSPGQIATIHHRPAAPPPGRHSDDRGSARNEIRVSGHSRR